MQTVMIAGASRGIGLEFAKQYAKEGCHVIATCRSLESAPKLEALSKEYSNIKIEFLDVTSEEQVKALANKTETPIDLLIISAGIMEPRISIEDYTKENIMHKFEVNAVGHFLVAQAFYPHVAKSQLKQIAAITSRMGSIKDNTSGSKYAYRASKAALNAIMKSFAYDLKDKGIHVSILHPGPVKTDMTRKNGTLTAEESVKRLRHILEKAPEQETGLFHSHDGSLLPW